MAYNYYLEDVAQDLWTDIGEPTDFGVGATKYWIKSAIGTLNNLLFTSFALNDAGNEFSPSLTSEEIAILKSLFMVWWYGKIIRGNLTASSFSQVLRVDSDGAKVQLAQSSSAAEVYERLKKEESENLKSLINAYRVNKSSPSQVAGIDSLDTGEIIIL